MAITPLKLLSAFPSIHTTITTQNVNGGWKLVQVSIQDKDRGEYKVPDDMANTLLTTMKAAKGGEAVQVIEKFMKEQYPAFAEAYAVEQKRMATVVAVSILKDCLGTEVDEFASAYFQADPVLFVELLKEAVDA